MAENEQLRAEHLKPRREANFTAFLQNCFADFAGVKLYLKGGMRLPDRVNPDADSDGPIRAGAYEQTCHETLGAPGKGRPERSQANPE